MQINGMRDSQTRVKATFMHIFGSINGRQMALYSNYDNVTKMFIALRMSAMRGQINCKTVSKLRSEKFKNTMLYKPSYSGYHGNKQTW